MQHTSTQFDAQLEQVRSKVLYMGGAVEDQLSLAVQALQSGELFLIDQVLDVEHQVNALEMEIDGLCTNIIARRTPTAIDLARTDDGGKDEHRPGTHRRRGEKNSPDGARIFSRAGAVTCRAIPRSGACLQSASTCCVRRSTDLRALIRTRRRKSRARDLEVDDSFRAILRELLTYMMEDPRTISATLDIIFIAKALERVGDHAKNISEYVVYMNKGKDVRHLSAEEIEQAVKS